ncbi:short-chain dehydrogenase [Candidatus Geothermarchaeota archaeon]|nr:MAG: short-chain dehydrogenase [Candidatus Geothermarchaeota archaeon]HEW93317.1 SDR family oxidoreductase [Thermoprotei archaeon]
MILIDLTGKKALVTASSKGIGKGIAEVLSIAGADVIIVSRDPNNLSKAADDIYKKSGKKVFYIPADLTVREDLEKIVNEAHKLVGDIDIFIFNTGGPKPGYFEDINLEDWVYAFRLLIYPAVYLTKAFIEGMKRRGWGRIIYSTSIAVKEPILGLTLSNSLRISMAGLVRTLAKEYGRYGITVNAIMPGYIKTERVMEIAREKARTEGISIEEFLDSMINRIPTHRMGIPEEIGYLTAFLASEHASYINGAIIPIDGGLLNSSL